MLYFLKVTCPQDIETVLQRYEPLQHTWIVSDLKSKQEIQTDALSQYSYFTDEAIMRMSDFWRLWMRRLAPTIQVVSSDFMKSLVKKFVEDHQTTEDENLKLMSSEVSTLHTAVQEFAPLLLHPTSRELMSEWIAEDFKKNKKIKKWQRWYYLADLCLKTIIQEHHVIDAKWSAAYLQSLDLKHFGWDRPLFIDLGSELSAVELDLFKILSQKQEVFFLTPDPAWKERFPFLKKIYEVYEGYGVIEKVQPEAVPQPLQSTNFIRLSTQLAEIKFATEKARTWAEAGVPLNQIAIIAADIEKYWPALQIHLDTEGLTYQKDTVARVAGLSDIQNLLARLQSLTDEVSWESLEKSVFAGELQTEKSFDKFKALFYQLFDQDDLGRDQKIKNLFYKQIDLRSYLDRDDFLSLIVKIWMQLPISQMKENLFEVVFKDILSQSLNIKLQTQEWIQFLRARMSRKEISLKRGQKSGLQVLSLMSSHMLKTPNKIYLGLNDEFFAKKQDTLMSSLDAKRIADDLGLQIDVSEESDLDFNIRWQASAGHKETYFTSAHLGFAAEPLNALIFFIENNPVSSVESTRPTRVDELQLQHHFFDEAWQMPDISLKRLQADKESKPFYLPIDKFKTLSVNDFNHYSECSFKLLASRGLKLRDYAQVSIDLDPREKGTLVHDLFEYLVQALNQKKYSVEATAEFLENKRAEDRLYLQADLIWSVQKNHFLRMAERFVAIEKDRLQFYDVITEKELQVYYDIENKSFSLQQPKQSFLFKMRTDRIDTHKQQKFIIIYDYKSTSSSKKNYSNWIKEKDFQMLLYIAALKQELQNPENLKGALYYTYKTFQTSHGWVDKTIGTQELGLGSGSGALCTDDKESKLQLEFMQMAEQILTNLAEGLFEAKPEKTSICKDCDWRKLCRATHLN